MRAGVSGDLSRAFSAAAEHARSLQRQTSTTSISSSTTPASSPVCSPNSKRVRPREGATSPSAWTAIPDGGGLPLLRSPLRQCARGSPTGRSDNGSLAGQDIVSPFEPFAGVEALSGSPSPSVLPSPPTKLSPLGRSLPLSLASHRCLSPEHHAHSEQYSHSEADVADLSCSSRASPFPPAGSLQVRKLSSNFCDITRFALHLKPQQPQI